VTESLRSHCGTHAANNALRRLVRRVQVCGLHLVPLDIREDARLQAATLDALFRRYGSVAHDAGYSLDLFVDAKPGDRPELVWRRYDVSHFLSDPSRRSVPAT
jgi:hypothetical protein